MSTPTLLRALRPICAVIACALLAAASTGAEGTVRDRLKSSLFKIAYEILCGRQLGNLRDERRRVAVGKSHDHAEGHEHYPQVSPDGTKISFSVDQGEGRETVRSLWVMDIDGTQSQEDRRPRPRAILESGRQGDRLSAAGICASFNVIDYSTKGMSFYHLDSGKIEPHPNSANLHHLYNPSFAPNGKWIVATVHARHGFQPCDPADRSARHKIINLKIPGCRPCLSPDGKQIAWGPGDHELATAPIDLDSDNSGRWPVGAVRIKDKTNKIYHVDWSPDGRSSAFSRGPEAEGD